MSLKVGKKLNRIDWAIFFGILVSAIGLYLFRLDEITPGFWADEVSLGLMIEALNKQAGFTPFINHNLGHPTPLIYLSGLVVAALGRTVTALRLVSVVAGGLSAAFFYLLQRRFFERSVAVSGSLMFATAYVLVIVSRFAYEMSAAILVMVGAGLLLKLVAEKITLTRLIALGALLGAGLYTYLAFRAILPVFIAASLWVIWKSTKNNSLKFARSMMVLISFLLIAGPLLVYGFYHPQAVNQRVSNLNVFGQQLSNQEIMKELIGASSRTLTMFFLTGDPNPRQNPAKTPPFDVLTSSLFIIGLGYLVWKRRSLGVFIGGLVIVVLATEIITLEQIPDFHYYGLGHPNTLRISLIVPVVLFCASWTLAWLEKTVMARIGRQWALVTLAGLVVVIVSVNLHRYFYQQPNAWIHTSNYVVPMQLIAEINDSALSAIAVSPSFYELEHLKYFLNPTINIEQLPTLASCDFNNLPATLNIWLAADLIACTQADIHELLLRSDYETEILINEWQEPDAIVVKVNTL